MEKTPEQFSKYERARVLGARGLQISMDAPILLKMDKKKLEELNFDALKIAEAEVDSGVLPISVNRPLPEKREESLERVKVKLKELSDEKKEEVEREEEKEIREEGEIMALANPEDESEESSEKVSVREPREEASEEI